MSEMKLFFLYSLDLFDHSSIAVTFCLSTFLSRRYEGKSLNKGVNPKHRGTVFITYVLPRP